MNITLTTNLNSIDLIFMCISTELIPKYLESFEKKFATQKEKEDDEKQKENNKQGLRELRDEMVFSVFMLNAIFVVVVSLVQQEKETLSFNWFFPKGKLINLSCIFLFLIRGIRSLVSIHISL